MATTTAEPKEPPHVDKEVSIKRVTKLESHLDPIWPKGEKIQEVKTTLDNAKRADAFYRSHLPPTKSTAVKLLILSESPCYTSEDLAKLKIDTDLLKAAGITLPKDAPEGHVNLWHCLTYGEPSLVDASTPLALSDKDNSTICGGTWAFWKVFATLAGATDVQKDGYDPLKSQETIETAYKRFMKPDTKDTKATRDARILLKNKVIEKLSELGIVLLDVSPFSIYLGGTNIRVKNRTTGIEYWTRDPEFVLDNKTYKAIVQAAFNVYSGTSGKCVFLLWNAAC
jgi:hypothetical protein